jgi:hypothetical protein
MWVAPPRITGAKWKKSKRKKKLLQALHVLRGSFDYYSVFYASITQECLTTDFSTFKN